MRFAKANMTVGKKSASVGCVTDPRRVDGFRTNRVVIAVKAVICMTIANMKKILPIVVKPGNRCGVSASSKAMPAVDSGNVNHAQVKLLTVNDDTPSECVVALTDRCVVEM